jgi:hypothetical protein
MYKKAVYVEISAVNTALPAKKWDEPPINARKKIRRTIFVCTPSFQGLIHAIK